METSCPYNYPKDDVDVTLNSMSSQSCLSLFLNQIGVRLVETYRNRYLLSLRKQPTVFDSMTVEHEPGLSSIILGQSYLQIWNE